MIKLKTEKRRLIRFHHLKSITQNPLNLTYKILIKLNFIISISKEAVPGAIESRSQEPAFSSEKKVSGQNNVSLGEVEVTS
jgi:hypothetical protein